MLVGQRWLISRSRTDRVCVSACTFSGTRPIRFALSLVLLSEAAVLLFAFNNALFNMGRGRRLEARIVLARLLQRFVLTAAPGYVPEPTFKFTYKPKNGFDVLVAPRVR